jgi:DNA-binding transcriptional ArsR family regulator
MTAERGRLTTDALFQILGNSRRRFIIRHLYQTERPVDLKKLAALIAADEEGTTPEALTDEERQRVYVSLYQTHLPTLTESGLVSYDEDERLLSLDRRALEEHCADATNTWLVGYAAIALVGMLAGTVFSLGSLPGTIGNGWLLLGLSALLGALVAAQYVRRTRADTSECLLSLVE